LGEKGKREKGGRRSAKSADENSGGDSPNVSGNLPPLSERVRVQSFEFKEERKRQESNRADSYTKHTKPK
jgi:hypothetical protein